MDSAMLSALDDMLSDVLLDQTHLWFQTHKMNEGYQPLIVNPDDILTIIQRRVIVEKNLDAAVKDLVKIPVFEGVLSTKKQKQDFKSHAKKYFGMYLATAGFDISQTDRYTAVTKKLEACVIATRDFDEGAELAQCAGSTAALTEQQDGELESDFSVIRTSRRGTFLFLGPARFVNHDCNPNCRFMWANNTTICFRALRPIRTNDEITTSYGDSYFGVNNKECLCATCESRGQGAFSGRGSGSEPSASGKVEGNSENAPPTRSLRSRKAVDYCLRKKPAKQCPTPPSPESSGGSESAPLPKKKLTRQQPTPLSPTSPGESDSAPDTPTCDSTDAQALVTPVPTPTRLLNIEFPPFTDDEDDGDDVDSAEPRAPATEEDVEYLFPIESEMEDRLLYAMKGFHITELKGKEVVRDYVPDRNLQPADTRVKAWQMTSVSSSPSPPASSKRNFRMSIDFLCSPPRDTDIEVHQSDTQSDAPESTAKVRTARTRTKSGKTAVVKEIDPDRCASCNTLTPHEQKDDSGDCRRCHRHLLLYGVAWPSRSKDALFAKFEQQDKQKRDALAKIAEDLKRIEKAEAAKAQAAAKAERAAAERARKKALAKEARAQARSATQAQSQAQRQAQNPAQAQAQLFTQAQAQDLYGFATAQAPRALLPGSHDATRLVNIRPKPAMGNSYNDVSVAHLTSHLPPPAMGTIGDIPSGPYRPLNNHGASQLISFPSLPPMGSDFERVPSEPYGLPTSNSAAHLTYLPLQPAMGSFEDGPHGNPYRPTTSQDAAYLSNPSAQPVMGSSDDLLSGPYRPRPIHDLVLDVSPIITEQHPYHHAPYLVFVDPQDSSAKFWWIAVTVPRSQMDLSMPDIPTLPDGSMDADLIVVRFLEDFKYAVCNISGLKLFLPDGPVYHGFVQSAGREFKKNLSVSRAFQFLDGHVPPNLRWRYMGFQLARPLPEIAEYVYHSEMQISALLDKACQWELARVHTMNQQWQQQQREIQQLREIQAAQLEIQAQQELQAAQQELEATQQDETQGQNSKGTKRRATDQPVKRKRGGRGPGKKTLEKRQRLEELERLRQEELGSMQLEEQERVRLEELERTRLQELERTRLQELERTRLEKLERARLEELERARVEEVEKARLEELEKARLEELEKARLEELEKARLEELENTRLEELVKAQIEELARIRLEALAEAEAELFDSPLSPVPTDLSDSEDEEDAQEEDTQEDVSQQVTQQGDVPHRATHLEGARQEETRPDEEEVAMAVAPQEDVHQNEDAQGEDTQEEVSLQVTQQEDVPHRATHQEGARQEETRPDEEEVAMAVAPQEDVYQDEDAQEETHMEEVPQEEQVPEEEEEEEIPQEQDVTQEEETPQEQDVPQEEKTTQEQDVPQEEIYLEVVPQQEVQLELVPQEAEAHLEEVPETEQEIHQEMASQEEEKAHQDEEIHQLEDPQEVVPPAVVHHQEEAVASGSLFEPQRRRTTRLKAPE